MKDTLFPLGEPVEKKQEENRRGAPRVLTPERNQVEMVMRDLESTVPAEHVARVIWDFAKGLNLGPLSAEIKPVGGHAGRPACPSTDLISAYSGPRFRPFAKSQITRATCSAGTVLSRSRITISTWLRSGVSTRRAPRRFSSCFFSTGSPSGNSVSFMLV